MALASKNQLKTRLAVMLRDASNKVYTDAEKEEALKEAIDDDAFVYVVERDNLTTTVNAQVQYDLPDGWDEVMEIRLDVDDKGWGALLDPMYYDVINRVVYFTTNLPNPHKLIFIGKRKLYTNDTFPEYLHSYILHMAAANCMEYLLSDKTGRFLKNDTSFAEITGAIGGHRSAAMRAQRTLPNRNALVL